MRKITWAANYAVMNQDGTEYTGETMTLSVVADEFMEASKKASEVMSVNGRGVTLTGLAFLGTVEYADEYETSAAEYYAGIDARDAEYYVEQE